MRRDEIVLVHSSDVHVDHDYNARRFGGDGVGPLRAVLAAARNVRAEIVLLVGDTFESHRLPAALVAQAGRLMADYEGSIVILPGNHDPAVADAVFHHPAMRAADNLTIFGVNCMQRFARPDLDIEIWGRAHMHYGDMDPLADPPPRGAGLRVALAHGHYDPAPDRSTRVRPSWLVGPQEISATGADYVAFGHWNRAVRVGACAIPAWYSGSPDYAGTVNVVRLKAGEAARVERAPLELPAEVRANLQGD